MGEKFENKGVGRIKFAIIKNKQRKRDRKVTINYKEIIRIKNKGTRGEIKDRENKYRQRRANK